MEIENFIQDLVGFVNLEGETQKKQVATVWAKPISERVLLGEAIDGVKALEVIENDKGLRLRKFRVQSNISKFRVGDYLLLHTGNIEIPVCCCQLYEETGLEMVLQENIYKTGTLLSLSTFDKFILDKDLPDITWITLNPHSKQKKKKNYIN